MKYFYIFALFVIYFNVQANNLLNNIVSNNKEYSLQYGMNCEHLVGADAILINMEHYKNLSLENIEGEIWKDVIGYEGIYQVSNFGRVKTLSRYIRCKNNNYRKTNERLIKQAINKKNNLSNGYCLMILNKDNIKKTKEVHRLVAENFIPNIENKRTVNHIDGNGINNHIFNLEWATDKEQVYHKNKILQRMGGGEKKVAMCDLNWNVIEVFKSVSEVKRKYNYNIGGICSFCRGIINHKIHGYYWKYI